MLQAATSRADPTEALMAIAEAGLGWAGAESINIGFINPDRHEMTIAADCTVADSYAKAVAVLGPEKGLALIEDTPGAAVLVLRAPEGTVETFESKRLRDYPGQSPGP